MLLTASTRFQQILSDFGAIKGGANYLRQVSDVVSRHRGKTVNLDEPRGSVWKVGGLADTVCKGNNAEKKEWEDFYMPERVAMEVIGAVEPFFCPYGQLVVLAGEDLKVYAHDGEELHLVATCLKDFCAKGLQHPWLQSFERGECFKDMDWDKLRQSAEGKRLDEQQKALVRKAKPQFMECLRIIQQARQGSGAAGSDPLGARAVVQKIKAV